MGEQSNAWWILLHDYRKNRHRRIKTQRRYERLALLCFGEEGSLRMCCCTDPLAVRTPPQKHQKSGVDVASEQLVVDCFGTSCPGAEEWWTKWDTKEDEAASFPRSGGCGELIFPLLCSHRLQVRREQFKWSEVGAARSQHVSGLIAGDSRVAWYKDSYHLHGWVSVTEVEPFSWKVSWLDLAKNGHGVRGNTNRRWSFHILDCRQGIPDSFQLHPGAARERLVLLQLTVG